MRSKYGRTVGSRSIAISFPRPWRSAASSREWPPAPKVASTTTSPGWTSSSPRTSSASTGTWSAASVRKTFGNISRAPFDRAQLGRPGRAVPDLDVVVHPCDDHVLPDPGVLGEGRWDDDAPLLVEVGDRRPREDVPFHLPRLTRERVEVGDPGHVRVPALAREDVDVPLDAARKHDAADELVAKASRERDPALLVDRVLVLAVEHGLRRDAVPPTDPHFTPHSPTPQPSR